jgi:hypothetical protein
MTIKIQQQLIRQKQSSNPNPRAGSTAASMPTTAQQQESPAGPSEGNNIIQHTFSTNKNNRNQFPTTSTGTHKTTQSSSQC